MAAEHDLVLDAAQKRGFDPETWTAERRELIWHSIFVKWSSYGLVARTMLPELERQGIDVTVAPSGTQAPRGLERFFRPLDHWGRFAVYFDWRDRPSVLPSERIICISPVDTTRVPEATIREINQAVALLYVPSRRNLQSYRESGVRVPTRVLHRGVDPDHFPVLERPQRETFTFGTFGDLSVRKGVDVLIRAFGDEFAPGEPVRLVLKTVQPFSHDDLDPRIRVVTGFLDRGRLLDLLAEMDAFVQPSRGEAFGLCGLQAMSTGLPLIATYWDGPVEYLEPSDTFPLSFTLVEAAGAEANYVRYFGTWAEPDYEHLRYLMRYLYEHPEEGRQKGALAAQRVRRDWGWGRIARQVRDDLDKIA